MSIHRIRSKYAYVCRKMDLTSTGRNSVSKNPKDQKPGLSHPRTTQTQEIKTADLQVVCARHVLGTGSARMPVYAEMSDASMEKEGSTHSSSQHKNESPQESSPSILIWPASLIIFKNLSDLGIEFTKQLGSSGSTSAAIECHSRLVRSEC